MKLNDCSSLESIDLPSYIEEISDKFFNNCTSLKNVDFNNCKIIGNYSFANTGFINLKLPITIEQVCEKAFYKSQIEEIHIYSTTTLNLNSLYGMDNLKKIIIHKNDNKTIDEIKENILNALGKYIYDIELVIELYIWMNYCV